MPATAVCPSAKPRRLSHDAGPTGKSNMSAEITLQAAAVLLLAIDLLLDLSGRK